MEDITYIIEEARRKHKSAEGIVEYINNSDLSTNGKKLALAKSIKNIILTTMDVPTVLSRKYKDIDYNPMLLKIGKEFFSKLDDDNVASLVCACTEKYWVGIRKSSLDHFFERQDEIVDDIKSKMSESNKTPQFDVMSVLNKIMVSVKDTDVDEGDINMVFKILNSMVTYCQAYQKFQ